MVAWTLIQIFQFSLFFVLLFITDNYNFFFPSSSVKKLKRKSLVYYNYWNTNKGKDITLTKIQLKFHIFQNPIRLLSDVILVPKNHLFELFWNINLWFRHFNKGIQTIVEAFVQNYQYFKFYIVMYLHSAEKIILKYKIK